MNVRKFLIWFKIKGINLFRMKKSWSYNPDSFIDWKVKSLLCKVPITKRDYTNLEIKETIATRSSASYLLLDVDTDGPLQNRIYDKRVDIKLLTVFVLTCDLPNRMKFTHLNVCLHFEQFINRNVRTQKWSKRK